MKIKYVSKQEEFAKMCAMQAGSNAQNKCLKQMYEQKEITYQDCLIMVDDAQNVVARIVMLDNYLGFYTLEKISLEDAIGFIKYVQNHTQHTSLIFHLYSDKCNHDLVMQSLLSCGFNNTIQKESYIQKPSRMKYTLAIKDYSVVSEEEIIDMFVQIAPGHKDRNFQEDYANHGILEASKKHYYESVEGNDPAAFRIVAYVNDKPVGLVFVKSLMDKIAGIGYIGVAANVRKNGYGKQLLCIASTIAFEHGYEQLQADIDEENAPMRDYLLAVGYTLSCKEKVFNWKR